MEHHHHLYSSIYVQDFYASFPSVNLHYNLYFCFNKKVYYLTGCNLMAYWTAFMKAIVVKYRISLPKTSTVTREDVNRINIAVHKL